MPARLFIINPTSPYFFYIPMGTFGLCDFLDHHGIESTIFNHALYPSASAETTLLEHLARFHPTHVAVLLHWQETAHGALEAINLVKHTFPELPVIVGGFTAGFFGDQLLNSCESIDYLVQGDPELPVLQLLQGSSCATVPNLIFREQGNIQRSNQHWLIDQATLDNLSFARTSFLINSELYFTRINTILGFPLFIGRGCAFDCAYCGGSRQAFSIHSNRRYPVARSIDSIIRDLYRLHEVTDILYICYENNQQYIQDIFAAIAAEDGLRGHFSLNYGAWHLLDSSFVTLYKKAFKWQGTKPVFEFSPEVISDKHRREIKGATAYGLEDLLVNCTDLSQQFAQQLRIELFFSRYHPHQNTKKTIIEEIQQIYHLKHTLFLQEYPSIHICYDHLSTDIGSGYWQQELVSSVDFDQFLDMKHRVDNQLLHPFPVDNLCFFIPQTLSTGDRLLVEALAQSLEYLEQHCHELFQVLFFCTQSYWIDVLVDVLSSLVTRHEQSFFINFPIEELLHELGARMAAAANDKDLSFVPDLFSFTIKKLHFRQQPLEREQEYHAEVRYCLNQERMSIHQYDYMDLPQFLRFVERHRNSARKPYQRTVCLYLDSTVLTLPHRSYRASLGQFEQGLRISTYLDSLGETAQIDRTAQEKVIQQLIANYVLLPCSVAQ